MARTWPSTATLDGFQLGQIGVVVDRATGYRDFLQVAKAWQRVPNRWGSVAVHARPQAADRLVVVRGSLNAESVAELRARRDELWWRLRGGGNGGDVREWGFTDGTGRIWRVVLPEDGISLPIIPPTYRQLSTELELPLLMTDPRILAGSDTVLAGVSTATDLVLGSEASLPVIEFSVGTATVTVKDHTGATMWTFGIAGASNPPITIDFTAAPVSMLDSLGNPVAAFVTAGSYVEDVYFDPQWASGNPVGSPPPTWPTIEVDAGTIDVTFRAAYG